MSENKGDGFKISPSYSPKMIERHMKESDDMAMNEMRETMERMEKTASAIKANTNKIMNNSLNTELANKKQARDHAFDLYQKMAKQIDRVNNRVQAEIDKDNEQTEKPFKEAATKSQFAKEIRDHLRTLNSDERKEFLNDAFQSGDFEAIGAVLGAPNYLSGLKPAERDYYKKMAEQQFFGNTKDRVSRLDKAREDMVSAAMWMSNDISRNFDSQELRQAEQTASEAEAARQADI